MVFNFYEYVFNTDLLEFINCLNKYSIKYKQTKTKIKFKIKNSSCKKDISVLATIVDNQITRLNLECTPINYKYKKLIERELDIKYNLIEKDINSMTRIYRADEYMIYVKNYNNIIIDVQFQPVTINKEKKQYYFKILLFSMLGLLLSIFFLILYFNFKFNLFFKILTCSVSICYALYQFIYLYIKKSPMDKTEKITICILVPLIYFLLISVVTIFYFIKLEVIFNPSINFSFIDIIIIFIYLAPSFHVLLLFIACLGYS